MTMSHFGYGIDIGHVRVRVTESLCINGLRIGLDGCFQSGQVIHVYNRIRNALCRQRMGNQVERSTVEVISSYHMVAYAQNVLQCIGCSGST